MSNLLKKYQPKYQQQQPRNFYQYGLSEIQNGDRYRQGPTIGSCTIYDGLGGYSTSSEKSVNFTGSSQTIVGGDKFTSGSL